MEVGPSNIFITDYKLQVLSRIFLPLTLRSQMFRNKSCFDFLKIPLSYPQIYHIFTKNKFYTTSETFRDNYIFFFILQLPDPPHLPNQTIPGFLSLSHHIINKKQARILKKTLPQKHKITILETIVYKQNTSRIYFIKCPNKAT